jgi:hypothetical protein
MKTRSSTTYSRVKIREEIRWKNSTHPREINLILAIWPYFKYPKTFEMTRSGKCVKGKCSRFFSILGLKFNFFCRETRIKIWCEAKRNTRPDLNFCFLTGWGTFKTDRRKISIHPLNFYFIFKSTNIGLLLLRHCKNVSMIKSDTPMLVFWPFSTKNFKIRVIRWFN